MNHIICHFEDGPTFLEHIAQSGFANGQHRSLTFVRDFALPADEVLRITIMIANSGESHDLHMRVDERSPSIARDQSGLQWRYRATPVEQDAPWLEMLTTKYSTAHRLSS